MITRKSDVKSKKQTVGVAEYYEYETVAEMTEDLGDVKVLELVNAQVRTNAMNIIRTNATKGPTKASLRNEATSAIIQEVGQQMHQDVIGDPAALERLITQRMAELEEAAMATTFQSQIEEDDDEEEDDDD